MLPEYHAWRGVVRLCVAPAVAADFFSLIQAIRVSSIHPSARTNPESVKRIFLPVPSAKSTRITYLPLHRNLRIIHSFAPKHLSSWVSTVLHVPANVQSACCGEYEADMLVCSPRNSHLRHLFSRLSLSSILLLPIALCSTLLSFALFRLAATISPNECERLNDYLGPKTPGGCFVLGHNDGDDPFTHGVEKGETPFQGKDATHHRNSWLWPKLARRVTKNSDLHQSRWRRPVEVSGDECSRICETRLEFFQQS